MKLTKSDKEAFVRAVMDDVPKVDYTEQYHKAFKEEILKAVPAKIRELWEDKETRDYLDTTYYHLGQNIGSLNFLRTRGMSDKIKEKLAHIADKAAEQKKSRMELEVKVAAAIYGCSTLKQAKERLPEFEKYLPADRDGTGATNLPAIANLTTDLMKAGWPKGQHNEAS